MKIISAKYILTCNEEFEILENHAIYFDEKIIDIDTLNSLKQKYKEAEFIELPKNSVILPGLINTHLHLEFSANKTSLNYGSFLPWLNSVIEKRDELLKNSTEHIKRALKTLQKSGVTTFGAISSFGEEIELCKKSPLRTYFFVEILGSRPDAVDLLFEDFKHRLRACEDLEDERLIPAISIHSPYSTHPILAKNALDIARKFGYVVSTHFMESKAEREWLDSGSGEFCEFFNNFNPNSKPINSPLDFIELFSGCKTLFTHCTQAKKSEIEKIKSQNGSITHCAVSNRLLGVGRLKIEEIDESILNLGTDGLSSNISLNLWDEMRMALMLHNDIDLNELSKKLLKMATINGAKALNLEAGEISKGKFADFIVCELDSSVENLAQNLILQTKFVKESYIKGERC